MSYPRNDPENPSVNAGIDSDRFLTDWGTFALTSEIILLLPPGCRAATFDISAAYRLTPISPLQQNALCISWKGKIYVDRALMFGLSSSAGVFGSVADMLVAIYRAAGFWPILKWVDDFLVIQHPDAVWTEDDFVQLTAQFGVPWAQDKTRPLATRQQYIGFIWDLEQKTVALPPGKLEAALSLVATWTDPTARFKANDAAHFHGKMVHVSSIFPLIRPFLRSFARFAASFHSARAALHPPRQLRKDAERIHELLSCLPNELPLESAEPLDLAWWGDASTSFGVGVTVGSLWNMWAWTPGFRVGPGRGFDIGWAEAAAVELGLLMIIHHGLLASRPVAQSRLLVRSDNSGVVAVLNSGRSRSTHTNDVLRRIYLLCAHHRVHLTAIYVPSRDNVTDALSRGDAQGFLNAFPLATTRSPMPLPAHFSPYLQLS